MACIRIMPWAKYSFGSGPINALAYAVALGWGSMAQTWNQPLDSAGGNERKQRQAVLATFPCLADVLHELNIRRSKLHLEWKLHCRLPAALQGLPISDCFDAV